MQSLELFASIVIRFGQEAAAGGGEAARRRPGIDFEGELKKRLQD